jgi:hypothetical protein
MPGQAHLKNNVTRYCKSRNRYFFIAVLMLIIGLCMNYASAWAAAFSFDKADARWVPSYKVSRLEQQSTETNTPTPNVTTTQTGSPTVTLTIDTSISPSPTTNAPSSTVTNTITSTASPTFTPTSTTSLIPTQTPISSQTPTSSLQDTPTLTLVPAGTQPNPTEITATPTLKPFLEITLQRMTATNTPMLYYIRQEPGSSNLPKGDGSIFRSIGRFWPLLFVFTLWGILLVWFVVVQLLDSRD